ncbi:MAG: Asp-tRNA(Asn)/Glu-tRNA(Gln) amidotransferase subunit GatB [Halobacteriales archaeon]
MSAQSAASQAEYRPVIGLEVHVQLETRTKIFCGCSTDIADAEPNTHTCPVCLGLPGSLPVVNEAAIEAAVRIGTAIDADIADVTRFHRKNYFYPDLPKNFQITQYDEPICRHGALEIDHGGERRVVTIERAHLEEDPGSLQHVGGSIATAEYTRIDYNRAGVPLMEIVTAPDFRAPGEVRAFLSKLERVLEYLGVFDAGRDGSLRVDANVSLVEAEAFDGDDVPETVLANAHRTEVKNISSHKGAERALAYEVTRQRNALRRGREVERETRHWDETRGITVGLRTKEAEADYRYFREHDIPAVRTAPIREGVSIPELPDARRARFVEAYDLNEETAAKLTSTRQVADLFEELAERFDANVAASWVADEILGELHYRDLTVDDVADRLDEFRRLIELVAEERITAKNAREVVLRAMLDDGCDPDAIVEAEGLGKSDEAAVAEAVEAVVRDHPDAVEDYHRGEGGALNYLVGQVMRETGGRADPVVVNELLEAALADVDDPS